MVDVVSARHHARVHVRRLAQLAISLVKTKISNYFYAMIMSV